MNLKTITTRISEIEQETDKPENLTEYKYLKWCVAEIAGLMGELAQLGGVSHAEKLLAQQNYAEFKESKEGN